MVFYSAFVWKCTYKCKHRFGVPLLQNPPLCSSTITTCDSRKTRSLFWHLRIRTSPALLIYELKVTLLQIPARQTFLERKSSYRIKDYELKRVFKGAQAWDIRYRDFYTERSYLGRWLEAWTKKSIFVKCQADIRHLVYLRWLSHRQNLFISHWAFGKNYSNFSLGLALKKCYRTLSMR
jgi:hypothetical protein